MRVLLTVLFCLLAWPLHAQAVCAPYTVLTEMLTKDYNEHLAGSGILLGHRGVFELWIGAQTWTIVVATPDGQACGVAAGEHWMPATFPPPGKQS